MIFVKTEITLIRIHDASSNYVMEVVVQCRVESVGSSRVVGIFVCVVGPSHCLWVELHKVEFV